MPEPTPPTDPKAVRAHILRGIRRELLHSGSSTRAELSRKLGLSFPTVGKFLARMEREGEIQPAGRDESGGGRPAVRYAYDPEYALCLSLFLERRETVYAVFDGQGVQKEAGRFPSVLEAGEEGLYRIIEPLLARFPRVRGIAVGVPGSVDQGRLIFIPGYDRFAGLDLRARCEERFGIATVIENDMNAAVLGYAHRENVPEPESLVYVYRGSNGPGAGILIGGQVVRGRSFFAGEIAFVPLGGDLNFGQALEEAQEDAALSGAGRAGREEEGAEALSRLVAALTAILNPSRIIFHGEEASPGLLERIAEASARWVPVGHLPGLVRSDWENDYLTGLYRLGLELLLEA
ncbi:ROK family transcriptional regulator [Paenibacillus glufosinatiresistens]|uniref:ROK family transcriptional regulator n=1 Tax=Paenibacillus glufosinatiresistens TaxID=3070657 RepID=UPI00286E96EA|nr:ROK family protein [Paenibacillus sp. YX.27]